MPRESKCTATLRELGFKNCTELVSAGKLKELDMTFERVTGGLPPSKLSRADRRKLVAEKRLPSFIFQYDRNYTYALDESCGEWVVDGFVDLTPFGFTDKTADFQKGIKNPAIRQMLEKLVPKTGGHN